MASSETQEPPKNTSSSRPLLQHILVAILSVVICLLAPSILRVAQGNLATSSTSSPTPRTLVSIVETDPPRFLCDHDTLSQYLHEEPVPGFHIVCLGSNGGGSVEIVAFQNGVEQKERPPQMTVAPQWSEVRRSIIAALQLRPEDALHQPWAIFSPVGERLVSEDDDKEAVVELLLKTGVLLVFQGGQFQWPGVRIGFRRMVDLYSIMPPNSPIQNDTRTLELETLSLHPLILATEDFLSKEECNHIQELATPQMQFSSVTFVDSDRGKDASDFRTSQSTFLHQRGDPILIDIDWRTSSLVRIPRQHQEQVQVLRYEKTQKYDSHHDFFNPDLYRENPSMLAQLDGGRRNRFVTVFWYLSDVPAGGETIFPRFNKAPSPLDYSDCSRGLKVKPQRGKVIIFYSMTPDGELDPHSLHGSCPVEEGIKWAANKWVWNVPMGYMM